MEFSTQQNAIIEHKIDNILVSAAAGSGKTTVLVERIIQKILAGTVTIDRLLVMTFTVAAAANMSKKIRDALKDKIASEADPATRKRLKEQLNLLPSAYIQTNDAFCARVLREKGNELEDLDIESGFSLVRDPELTILMKKAAVQAVNERYLSFASVRELEHSDYFKLINLFGDGRSDAALEDNLVSIYRQLRSLPNYIDKVDSLIDKRIQTDESGDILMLDDMVLRLKEFYSRAYETALDLLEEIDLYKEGAKERYYQVKDILECVVKETTGLFGFEGNAIETLSYIRESFDRLASLSLSSLAGFDGDFKSRFYVCAALPFYAGAQLKGVKNGAGKYFPSITSEMITEDGVSGLFEHQKNRTALLKEYAELLRIMDIRFSEIKKRARLVDFSDKAHYALKILSDPKIGSYYREKFCEIYVDEYQDNSSLQDSIVAAISDHNLFTVGDVKQSIYKFRYANPQNFIRRGADYKSGRMKGQLINLNNNFRSSKKILDFVNVIFRQLMRGDVTEIEYDESQYLNVPEEEKYVKLGEYYPKVLIVTKSSDKESMTDLYHDEDLDNESKKFREMFSGVLHEVKGYLFDPSHKPSDICILVRTGANVLRISKYLNLFGIPTVCQESRKIYEDPDLAAICALLTILDNEHRDDSLVGVMLAAFRFSNFTVDELAEITVYSKQIEINEKYEMMHQNLIIKLRAYADQRQPDNFDLYKKVTRFLNVLDDLRSEAIVLEIGELIERIFAETGILANVKERSEDDVNKFRDFKSWICQEFSQRAGDLSYVASVLDQLKLETKDTIGIDQDGEDDNSVKVMTMHKSKGLEYPFVIVANLESAVVKSDDKAAPIIFDENLGFISNDCSDGETVLRQKSLENLIYDEKQHLANMSEELRLLYVALTRAKDKLSIVINESDVSKEEKEILTNAVSEKREKFDRDTHLRFSKTSSEFVLALARIAKADDIRAHFCNDDNLGFVNGITDFDGVEFEADEPANLVDWSVLPVFEETKPVVPTLCISDYDRYGNPIFEEYKYEESVNAPAKTSVSEMKREELKLSYTNENEIPRIPINLIVPKKEFFDVKNSYSSASSKGSLIHDLLHFLDFPSIKANIDGGMSVEDALKDEITYLKERGIVKDKMLPVIDGFMKELQIFFSSDLFLRIVKAEEDNKAYFERPIMFSVKVGETDDDSLVQGVLDVMFIEDGEAVIVDYKTDSVKTDDLDEIRRSVSDRHKFQLDLYAAAVEASGIKVKEKLIWLIRKGLPVKL